MAGYDWLNGVLLSLEWHLTQQRSSAPVDRGHKPELSEGHRRFVRWLAQQRHQAGKEANVGDDPAG